MRVSVVMAGRNSNPDLLKEAINSILNQTFQDFEFIFVDDGSNEPIEPLVRSITSDDRVAVYRIKPSGLGAALNYGIKRSRGDLIARIDDDDISLPMRLEKQVSYMDSHPEVYCLGTQLYYKFGKKVYPHPLFPLEHEEIVRMLAKLHFVIAHTVVMFRRSGFDEIGGYRISGGGQDLDLFLQFGSIGKLHNLKDYLGCYSLSMSGLSFTNSNKKEAYSFALKEALKEECYETFYNDINSSLVELMKGNKKSFLYRISPSRRKMLIWITKYLGRDYDKMITVE